MSAKLTAIEFHYPSRKLSNDDLQLEFANYDFAKFEEKVGIKNRYLAAEDETALDLAVAAAEKLFTYFDKSTIDYVLYCTQSPEYILPTTACVFQHKVGLKQNIGALDFNLGCSGYTYGLSMAKGLINSKQAKNVLLVTAETYSKFLHPLDRSNRALFGDAATVSVISESEEDAIGNFLFGTDGAGYDQLIIKNGGAKFRYSPDAELIAYGTENSYTANHLYMDGPAIFNFTSSQIPNFTTQVVEANHLDKTEIHQFIFHQANAFMLNFMRKKLKVDNDNFFIDLADGGNTVSNTIPIALKKYSQLANKPQEQNIILMGFGVGLS
ncbi:MAG: ketoacyl-ACP synthase III, partial [Flavobacterium sp.]